MLTNGIVFRETATTLGSPLIFNGSKPPHNRMRYIIDLNGMNHAYQLRTKLKTHQFT